MRKLLWFTLGFGAACGFCAYGREPMLLTLPVLALLTAYVFPGQRIFKVMLAVLGVVCGLFWYSRFETVTLQPVYELDGVTMETQIRCKSFPEETDYGYRTEGSIRIGEKDYTVLCYLDESENLEPGSMLSGPFRLKVTAPGGMGESAYYQGEGVFLLAYQADAMTVTAGQQNRRDIPAILRQRMLEILEEMLPRDVSVFAKALLLGDTSDLDYITKTDFTVSGIRHIVAVSGLHVSILFSLTKLLSFRKRYLSDIIPVCGHHRIFPIRQQGLHHVRSYDGCLPVQAGV